MTAPRRDRGSLIESVTAVVVAFHRPEPLAELLACLDPDALDIVVVNVGMDADVTAVARACRVDTVEVAGNPGYAAAVNAGAQASAPGVVVFLNDDCRIGTDDVLQLASVVWSGEADVAVPRVLDGRGQLERTIQAVPTPASLAREWMLLPDRPVAALAESVTVQKWRAPEFAERIEAAAAVVVAVRRDLLLELPLPEHYFLYWEESEWFWHLRDRGAVVQYRPEATCVHDGGRDDVRPEKSRLLARNAVRCVRVTQGRIAAAAAWLVVIAWNTRLCATDALRTLVHPVASHRRRLRARWAGLEAACSSCIELR